MKRRVVFCAEGGGSIGMGHIMRSIALAEMIFENFDTALVISSYDNLIPEFVKESIGNVQIFEYEECIGGLMKYISENDIVVLDGYHFTEGDQKKIKQSNTLVCIDDLHTGLFYADAVINHCGGFSPLDYKGESYTKFFLGPEYAMVRKPFLESKITSRDIDSVENIFICMGGSDVNNVTLQVLNVCNKIKNIKRIRILTGSANKNINALRTFNDENTNLSVEVLVDQDEKQVYELMENSELAICSASVVSYEVCLVGMGLIIIQTADNQIDMYKYMSHSGMATGVSELSELFSAIENFLYDSNAVQQQMEIQRKYFDRKSNERILALFHTIGAQ